MSRWVAARVDPSAHQTIGPNDPCRMLSLLPWASVAVAVGCVVSIYPESPVPSQGTGRGWSEERQGGSENLLESIRHALGDAADAEGETAVVERDGSANAASVSAPDGATASTKLIEQTGCRHVTVGEGILVAWGERLGDGDDAGGLDDRCEAVGLRSIEERLGGLSGFGHGSATRPDPESEQGGFIHAVGAAQASALTCFPCCLLVRQCHGVHR